MNILVTGANGFIAREIIIRLVALGHRITACVRTRSSCILQNGPIQIIQTDFRLNTHQSDWLSLLSNIDIVINCVGVFQTKTSREMWDIHYHAPRALFDACSDMNIKKLFIFQR